jgi:hypothetical protein
MRWKVRPIGFAADLTAAVAASDQYCGRAERSRTALSYRAVESRASHPVPWYLLRPPSVAHHLATIICLPYGGLWPMLF